MRPHFPIFFLITFSFILCACADIQGHDTESQSGATPGSDIHAKWIEFMSFLDPANIADKMQVPLVSNILANHLVRKADEVQHDPRTPDLLQQSLEVLISEEAANIIRSLETVVNSTLALGMTLYDILVSTSSDDIQPSDPPLNPLLKNMAKVVMTARDDFRERFPWPATAPGHAAREKSVSDALEHFQRLFVRFVSKHEIEHGVIERYLAHIEPYLHDVGVLIGDVNELYPAAIEALVLNLSAMLFPEAVFLRSLVILYCFGPYVLGKDAIGGWLLKHVSEALKV